jgi:hypothetical protein
MAALFPPGSQSSDKYAHHGEYQYAVSAGNALSLCQRKELHHLHTTWRAPDYAPGFNLGIGIGPVGIGIGVAGVSSRLQAGRRFHVFVGNWRY